MSDFAEYARELHEKEARVFKRNLKPHSCAGRFEKLKGVRAVIFDVYGTLVNYWRTGFENTQGREEALLGAFRELVGRFGMEEVLAKMNPGEDCGKTLSDLYHGLIALNHEKAVNKGAKYPEILVERIWSVIVMMLERNGYSKERWRGAVGTARTVDTADLGRYLGFTYNFLSMGRELYPEVTAALKKLKEDNIVLGIMSNAQFYTPIDLTLFFRDQSGGKIEDFNELFDPDLTFFSFEYGVRKPDELLFRKLFDALYEYHINPSQTVLAGNDFLTDIHPAATLGMRTAFFCGDDSVAFEHGLGSSVTPDIVFEQWDELSGKISFHGEMEDN
ncbi:MAG: HAD family hydrolase [Chitinispirillales bacterium]|jgi:putative hydrolase of the HAD superfamily|nr:HAD family hydrolase [Chitinispirillales bacterium]